MSEQTCNCNDGIITDTEGREWTCWCKKGERERAIREAQETIALRSRLQQAEAELEDWHELRELLVVPTPNGQEKPANANDIAGFIGYLESEWDGAEKRLEQVEAELADLQHLCGRAKDEIYEHWATHVDNDGYGPTNLMRNLSAASEGKACKDLRAGNEALSATLQELQTENAAMRDVVEAARKVIEVCDKLRTGEHVAMYAGMTSRDNLRWALGKYDALKGGGGE